MSNGLGLARLWSKYRLVFEDHYSVYHVDFQPVVISLAKG